MIRVSTIFRLFIMANVITLLPLKVSNANSFKAEISIGVFEEHYQVITNAVAKYGCNVNALSYDETNQMLAEYIILCKAFEVTGNSFTLTPVPFPLHKRIFQQLYQGSIAISGMGMWLTDADTSRIVASTALIKPKEFSKGLYYNPDNTVIAKDISLADFKLFNAVTNKNWLIDHNALTCSEFNVTHANRYKAMFKMIEKGRIDIVPHAFTRLPKMALEKGMQTLLPIPGYKIEFDDSLHYFISKEHQHSAVIANYLNEGIEILRGNGTIQKVYQQLGIIRSETKNWQVINCS